ncbi:MAG: TCR/Tet family MFS transporter [Pseudomonadales bacterium]|nr:TCR/Tet family MFS transporter [Pseudomonadales bacterium]MBO6595778.1 TCR/Tet family MFS transporter [Pseudomonadales bacterium]MBO6702383.1 TCR/Tet family MFS transporter [Pseudomonadales bacterium]MBO6822262.1 TCR/Tet family MFS transporter [Pseudomonadales bacterium]MBO7007617.1 TCR/Tet family MFS transporter [Pseudomonadales bacterium]
MPDRRFVLTVVFLTALIDSIGFGIIMPVTPVLLMEVTGEGLSAAAVYGGWLMFAFAIMQFIFMPVLGNLSDAYGRRPILLISLFALTINYVIMGFAESLLVLFIGRLISGIGSATFSTCNAYIADSTTPEERAQYFGLTGAAFGLGFVIGPALGGFLGEFGSRVPFFATAGLIFFNFVLGLFFLPESLEKENRRKFEPLRANPFSAMKQISQFRIVFGIMGVMFLYNMGHHVLPAVWSYWGMERFEWGPIEVGYSLTFVGILMVFSQGYLIRLAVPALGLKWAGIVGLSFNMAAFLGYAWAPTALVAYIFLAMGSLGGLAGPALNGIASTQIGPDQQGELQGAMGSMMSLTSILSPPMMTMTFGAFTMDGAPIYYPGAPFVVAAVLTLLSLLLFLRTTSDFEEKTAAT